MSSPGYKSPTDYSIRKSRITSLKSRSNQPSDVERPSTWFSHRKQLCRQCVGSCCSLLVEVRVADQVRMEALHPYVADEPAKQISRRLRRDGTSRILISNMNSSRSPASISISRPGSAAATIGDRIPAATAPTSAPGQVSAHFKSMPADWIDPAPRPHLYLQLGSAGLIG